MTRITIDVDKDPESADWLKKQKPPVRPSKAK